MASTFTVELAPPPGLDSDESTFKAQGRWADGSNIRFYNGSPQSLGAYQSVISVPGALTIVDFAVLQSTGSAGATYTIIGTGNYLLASAGLGAAVDKTPVALGPGGLPVAASSWSFAQYADTILCNPILQPIYQYTMGGGAATVLTNSPAQTTVILTARRQVLAFGTNEELSGTFNANCIRGSDIENPTVWATSSTNNAFEDILDDQGGIIAAKVIGDYIAVWTQTSLWMGTYLGNPGQVYQWEKVAGGQGCVSVNAACVDGALATWFAPDFQIWQWSPGGIPAPVPCPISRAFVASLGDPPMVRLIAVPHYNEIWLIYASSSSFDSRPDSYIAFNRQGQWFKGTLQRNAAFANGLVSALVRSNFSDPAAGGAFLASVGNVIYAHELSSGTFPIWSLTSADQYLDNGRRRIMIKRLDPDFTDSAGTINLTLSMRDRPLSTPVSKGPYPITTSAKKVDFRASGMIASATFEGSSFVRFGKLTFDCVDAGGR
jgi:hypothetical protein